MLKLKVYTCTENNILIQLSYLNLKNLLCEDFDMLNCIALSSYWIYF